jgi:hypothetical protein
LSSARSYPLSEQWFGITKTRTVFKKMIRSSIAVTHKPTIASFFNPKRPKKWSAVGEQQPPLFLAAKNGCPGFHGKYLGEGIGRVFEGVSD